ncbi:MAG TPA: hypothetical protein VGO52_12630, partial [Hyphomonadaceae bacterium]|nr:hypothetical protein [Hyphomonadaceae bacterium]
PMDRTLQPSSFSTEFAGNGRSLSSDNYLGRGHLTLPTLSNCFCIVGGPFDRRDAFLIVKSLRPYDRVRHHRTVAFLVIFHDEPGLPAIGYLHDQFATGREHICRTRHCSHAAA